MNTGKKLYQTLRYMLLFGIVAVANVRGNPSSDRWALGAVVQAGLACVAWILISSFVIHRRVASQAPQLRTAGLATGIGCGLFALSYQFVTGGIVYVLLVGGTAVAFIVAAVVLRSVLKAPVTS